MSDDVATVEKSAMKVKAFGSCCRCGDRFESYQYSGIMIPLCKKCRYGEENMDRSPTQNTKPKFVPGQILSTGTPDLMIVADQEGRGWVIDPHSQECWPLKVKGE